MQSCLPERNQKRSRADYEPENAKLEKQLTLWTSVGIALLLAPGLYAWAQFVNIPGNASVVEAVGRQTALIRGLN